jgi:hypothetical protein
MRWMTVALAAALAAGAPAAQSGAAAQPTAAAKLTAAQIIAKNVAARGGLEAWRKTQTMIWVGQLQSGTAPVPSMPFVLEQKRPNKTRFEINGAGQRTMRVFDGVHGWKVRAKRGDGPDVTPFSPPELKFASDAQAIDGPLIDYAARGSSVTLEGAEKIEGRKAYRFTVKLASGEHQDVWVDAKTFLDIRVDRQTVTATGAVGMVPVYYRNYKTFDGLEIPTTIEIGTGSGSVPDKMQIERIVVNPPLDDRVFEKPGTQHRRNAGLNTLPNPALRNRVISGLPAAPPTAPPALSSPPDATLPPAAAGEPASATQ